MSHKIIQLVRKFTGGVIAPVNAVFADSFSTNTPGCTVTEAGKLVVEHDVTSVTLEATFPANNTGSTPSFLIKANTSPDENNPTNLVGWSVIGKGSAINENKSTIVINIGDDDNKITYGIGICAFVLQKASVNDSGSFEM